MTIANKTYPALLIDLDGTMYHGNTPIDGAAQLITYLQQNNYKYLFLTNNSSSTPEQVAARLNSMGIPARIEDVCTSAQATAHYIKEQEHTTAPKAYVIGEEGLRHALTEAGIEITETDPDYVVQGIDKAYNYEKAQAAVCHLLNGAKSILTNPDLLLPTDHGLIPGAGSIGAMLQAASGVKPIVIGKPSNILVEFALNRLGVLAKETLVVGDNMSTDIAAGYHAGCGTALLYTGLTKPETKQFYTEQAGCDADYIFDTIFDLQTFLMHH